MIRLRDLLKESPLFFYKVQYSVNKGLYRDSEEVLKTTLHFTDDNVVLKIPKYQITYEGIIDGNETYLVKLYSNVDKETLQKVLDGSSTRAEKYKIL